MKTSCPEGIGVRQGSVIIGSEGSIRPVLLYFFGIVPGATAPD